MFVPLLAMYWLCRVLAGALLGIGIVAFAWLVAGEIQRQMRRGW